MVVVPPVGTMTMVQDFLAYRRRFRPDNGLIDMSPEEYPRLAGWPPNLIQETDWYQSLLPEIEGKNADGAYFSLLGERLLASVVIASGHKHDSEKTLLDWVQLASWQPASDFGVNLEGGTIEAPFANFDPRIGFDTAVLPVGASSLYLRTCLTAPVGAGTSPFVVLQARVFGDNDLTFTQPQTRIFVYDMQNGKTYNQAWLESTAIDVSLLPLTAERGIDIEWRFFFLGGVGVPQATVWALQAGLRAGA